MKIESFVANNATSTLHATVSWDPADPQQPRAAQMDDLSPRNSGVAFLHLVAEGAALRFETWFTDTNGDYTANAIDIFRLPIDLGRAFPFDLHGRRVPSAHRPIDYVLSARPDEANGFILLALPRR